MEGIVCVYSKLTVISLPFSILIHAALGLLKLPDSDMSTCTPSGSETEEGDHEQRDRIIDEADHDEGREGGGRRPMQPPLEPIRIRNLEDLFNSILY